MNQIRIILASASPRRKYLLKMLLDNFGLKFRVIPANIEEYLPNKIRKTGTFVENLSFEKARDIAEKHKGLIIGADTLVALTGKVM